MRVLLVTPFFPTDHRPDRGTFVADQARTLIELGHEVGVIAPVWRVPRGLRWLRPDLHDLHLAPHRTVHDGIRVEHPRMVGLPGHILPSMTEGSLGRRLPALVENMLDAPPDHLICHSLWPMLAISAPIAARLDAPLIGWVHGWDVDGAPSRVIRRTQRLLHRAIDAGVLSRLVSVTERQRGILVGWTGNRIPVEVIPCPTSVPESERGPIRSRDPTSEGAIRLLFGASPDRREKDHPLFLAAVAKLRRRGHDVETDHLGGLHPKDVRARIHAADAVVLTSRREGSPLVPREAIAIGRPVAAVDVGDLTEWMPDEALARVRDPDRIADAILVALSLPAKAWKRLPQHEPEHARDRLDHLLSDEG